MSKYRPLDNKRMVRNPSGAIKRLNRKKIVLLKENTYLPLFSPFALRRGLGWFYCILSTLCQFSNKNWLPFNSGSLSSFITKHGIQTDIRFLKELFFLSSYGWRHIRPTHRNTHPHKGLPTYTHTEMKLPFTLLGSI